MEYPHCKDCTEHYYCKKHGLSDYKPRFLRLENYAECLAECPYDQRCRTEAVFECSQYRQWCEEDLEVAKELKINSGCYRLPKPSLFDKIIKLLGGKYEQNL